MAPRDTLFLIAINLIWGLTPLVLKFGMAEMPPLLMMALRFVLASVLLARLMRWHGGQMRRLLAIALTGGALGFACLAAGLARVGTMAPVGIANQLNVPFAVLLSILMLGEVVRWRRWLGMGLAFAGGVLVAFDPRVTDHLDGFTLVTLAALLNAVSIILMRGVKNVRPLELQAWLAQISWPVLLVLSLVFEPHPLAAIAAAGWPAWFAMAFGALGTTMIAHAGFYYIVQRYEVSKVAPFLLLSPLFTVLFGVALMGDQLTWRIALGGTMTLVGVTIINLRDKHVVEDQVTP